MCSLLLEYRKKVGVLQLIFGFKGFRSFTGFRCQVSGVGCQENLRILDFKNTKLESCSYSYSTLYRTNPYKAKFFEDELEDEDDLNPHRATRTLKPETRHLKPSIS